MAIAADNNSGSSKYEDLKLAWFGVRHIVAFMCFSGYAMLTNVRNCLNIAIVKMVLSYNLENRTIYEPDQLNSSVFKETDQEELSQQDEMFDWDEKTVGMVLGSFYYGYTFANAIGGRIADYWGARYSFGLCVAFSSLITLSVPAAAEVSPFLLIAVRIIHGCIDGLGFPGISTLIAKWYPNHERSKFTSYIYSGGNVGTVLSMFISGWICSSEYFGSWPTVFYFNGVVGLVCTIFWFLLVSETPNSHSRISDKELIYITKDLPSVSKERLPLPWIDVFKSKYFWVLLLTNFGTKYLYYTVAIQLPTYFNNVLNIDLKNNGMISALPFLGSWIFSSVYGYFISMLSSCEYISILSIRKISMVVGGYVPTFGLIAIALLKCDSIVLIVIFIISMSLFGAIHCGYFCSYADLAPNFSGSLFGISNTFGGLAGCLTPLVTSLFLENYDLVMAWRYAFLTAATLTGVSTTLYIAIITTEIQPWNEPKEKEENRE